MLEYLRLANERRRIMKARMIIGASIAFLAMCAEPIWATSEATTIEQSAFARELMNMSEAQLRKLEEGKKKGLLELRPVLLPTEEYIVGKNAHFGWPIATKAGDALVVIYLRRCAHYHAPPWDQDSSGCMMMRSLDGGRTWSKPTDLRQYARKADGSLPFYSKGECITTTSDGAIVLGHEYGTFRSEDQGVTWEHYSHDPPFSRRLSANETTTFNCPRLIEHPTYGLVRMCGIKGVAEDQSAIGWPIYTNKVSVANSLDGGRTWKEQKYEVPIVGPAEPAMLLHEGALIVIGRPYHKTTSFRKTWTTPYTQHWSKTGWFPLQGKLTNMSVTNRWKSDIPGKGLDTVDLSFNPVTKRLEVVATDRMGGGVEERRWQVQFSVNLWSIDPEDLLAGSAEWRFEGCLFERQHEFPARALQRSSEKMSDGCHPGAAVIDEKEGVQHIFVYMGSPAAPAGIFHLKRTLETDKLSDFLMESN